MANETVVRLGFDLKALRAGNRMADDIDRKVGSAKRKVQNVGTARGADDVVGADERARLDVLNSADPSSQAARRANRRGRLAARAGRLRGRDISGQRALDRLFTPINAVREKGTTAARALTGISGTRGIGALLSIGAEGVPGLISRGGPIFAAIGIAVSQLFDRLERDLKNEIRRVVDLQLAEIEQRIQETRITTRIQQDIEFAREIAKKVFDEQLRFEEEFAAAGIRVDESQGSRTR